MSSGAGAYMGFLSPPVGFEPRLVLRVAFGCLKNYLTALGDESFVFIIVMILFTFSYRVMSV